MRILTMLGTRPEIIRLCRIIQKLDALCEQVVVHTGHNYDHNLNEVFTARRHVSRRWKEP